MATDLLYMSRLTQKTRRAGNGSIFIETYLDDATLVDSYECTNAVHGRVPSVFMAELQTEILMRLGGAAGGGGAGYTDAQALAAAKAGIPASALTAAQTQQDQNDGVPEAITGARTLAQADSRKLFTLTATQAITVPTGLLAGFGVQFQGAGVPTFPAVSGVTITDQRQSGLNPYFAALINIGSNAYIVRGDKA